VSADAVHLVVNAVATLVEIAFHWSAGNLLGRHADLASRARGPGIAVAIGDDFMEASVSSWPSQKDRAAFAGLVAPAWARRPFRPLRGNNFTHLPTFGCLSQFRASASSKVVDKKLFQFLIKTFHICSKFAEGSEIDGAFSGRASRLCRPSNNSK